jgi:hypothetical protein
MARHTNEAYHRARSEIAHKVERAVNDSRNSRSAASRLYQGRPSGEVPTPPRLRDSRSNQNVLPARAMQEIERAAGPLASQVRGALLSAGLIGARPAARSPQSGVSPLGGQAV